MMTVEKLRVGGVLLYDWMFSGNNTGGAGGVEKGKGFLLNRRCDQ